MTKQNKLETHTRKSTRAPARTDPKKGASGAAMVAPKARPATPPIVAYGEINAAVPNGGGSSGNHGNNTAG